MTVATTRLIRNDRVRHWKYAKECADVGGGLMPEMHLKVDETSTRPGEIWVRLELPSDPPRYLKVSGEEFGLCFRMVR